MRIGLSQNVIAQMLAMLSLQRVMHEDVETTT